MKRFILATILLTPHLLFSQKENNIWYFGNNAGIDFNNGSPVALTNGALSTSEGSASISDASGSLLFYTDGQDVWNKNHDVMPNGSELMGHWSSCQSALIVKRPGADSVFYVFTADHISGFNGLRYTEVDMNLQNGMGDVTDNKNVPIIASTSEKITAVKHQNNIDYWIIAHSSTDNTIYSFLLTCSGINVTPVESNFNSSYSLKPQGFIKASVNRDHIAISNYLGDNVMLFDFDNATGVLDNMMIFDEYLSSNPVGIEFSPNGQFLYVSEMSITEPFNVYQYNLHAGSEPAISDSRTVIKTDSGYAAGALVLAPDNKIYHAYLFKNKLGVIDEPNAIGASANYNVNGFSLNGRNSSLGLPNSFHHLDLTPPPAPIVHLGNDTNLCVEESLNLEVATANTTYMWQDGSTSSSFDIYDEGTYWVELTSNCRTSSDTIQVSIADCEAIIEMPNVFSPNNDGMNDMFMPIESKSITSMTTIIFDRYGKQLLETTNPNIEWNGDNAKEGTYFWVIEYTDTTGLISSIKGKVTLLR